MHFNDFMQYDFITGYTNSIILLIRVKVAAMLLIKALVKCET